MFSPLSADTPLSPPMQPFRSLMLSATSLLRRCFGFAATIIFIFCRFTLMPPFSSSFRLFFSSGLPGTKRRRQDASSFFFFHFSLLSPPRFFAHLLFFAAAFRRLFTLLYVKSFDDVIRQLAIIAVDMLLFSFTPLSRRCYQPFFFATTPLRRHVISPDAACAF